MIDDLKQRLNESLVSMASRGQLPTGKRLPPALWENLRQRLQRIYRNATGESLAVLSIEHTPDSSPTLLQEQKDNGGKEAGEE